MRILHELYQSYTGVLDGVLDESKRQKQRAALFSISESEEMLSDPSSSELSEYEPSHGISV